MVSDWRLMLKHHFGTAVIYNFLSELSRDLYVQALAALQAVNENDTLSYFQIMGE